MTSDSKMCSDYVFDELMTKGIDKTTNHLATP